MLLKCRAGRTPASATGRLIHRCSATKRSRTDGPPGCSANCAVSVGCRSPCHVHDAADDAAADITRGEGDDRRIDESGADIDRIQPAHDDRGDAADYDAACDAPIWPIIVRVARPA